MNTRRSKADRIAQGESGKKAFEKASKTIGRAGEEKICEPANFREISKKAIRIIQKRYESAEYKNGLKLIETNEQKIYGAIDKVHTKAVLDWVLKLMPDTPEALQIAAAGHDWDRAFEEERDKLEEYPYENNKPVKLWYDVHKAMHSANGARILKRELRGIVPPKMMLDIVYLVLHHEIGGRKNENGQLEYLADLETGTYNLNEAAEVLQQADSLAFFNVLDIYVEWRKPEKIKQKIAYMFDRIQDPKVREIIRGLKFENPVARSIFAEVMVQF